jgi:hypothetical protein
MHPNRKPYKKHHKPKEDMYMRKSNIKGRRYVKDEDCFVIMKLVI